MHFNPYFSCTVYPTKVGIKMHALSYSMYVLSWIQIMYSKFCIKKLSLMITKLSNIQIQIFLAGQRVCHISSVPNFKYLCNSIPKLCNVFEDPSQCVHTIEFHLSCFIQCFLLQFLAMLKIPIFSYNCLCTFSSLVYS